MNIQRVTLAFLIVVMSLPVFAQNYKVETVKMKMEVTYDRKSTEWYTVLDECLTDINAAKEHPKTGSDPKMYYYYGLTYLQLSVDGNEEQKAKYPDALKMATDALEECVRLDSKKQYTDQAEISLTNCAIGYYNLGVNSYQAGDFKDALMYYERTISLLKYDKNEDLKRYQITEQVLTQYASFAALQLKDFSKAKMLLQRLIDANYNDPTIYADMADISLIEGDTAAAMTAIATGREMYPNHGPLIDKELDLYLKLGRSEEIITKLNNAIANDPENVVYYYARGVSYMKLQKFDEAEADYLKATQLDPNYADAYYNLGVIYLEKCNPIVDEINALTGNYQREEQLAAQIDNLYKQAAKQFEEALALNAYSGDDLKELVETLRKIYGRLIQNNPSYKARYDEIKAMQKDL